MPGPLENVMKIGTPADAAALATLATGQSAASDAAKSGRPGAAATPPAADASAKVALSSAAANLRAGGASGDFDAEKVARVAKSIADGTFKVNPEVIADKLIANAQELLSRVPRT
jgi:negative regulator of flagellin synthesis FlgM